jgi:hypothetical protein
MKIFFLAEVYFSTRKIFSITKGLFFRCKKARNSHTRREQNLVVYLRWARDEHEESFNVYDGYTWLYMVIHGYIWLYMVIYGYTWLYMVIHGYI